MNFLHSWQLSTDFIALHARHIAFDFDFDRYFRFLFEFLCMAEMWTENLKRILLVVGRDATLSALLTRQISSTTKKNAIKKAETNENEKICCFSFFYCTSERKNCGSSTIVIGHVFILHKKLVILENCNRAKTKLCFLLFQLRLSRPIRKLTELSTSRHEKCVERTENLRH